MPSARSRRTFCCSPGPRSPKSASRRGSGRARGRAHRRPGGEQARDAREPEAERIARGERTAHARTRAGARKEAVAGARQRPLGRPRGRASCRARPRRDLGRPHRRTARERARRMSVPTVVGTRSPGTGPALLLGPSLGTSTALWGPAAALLTGHFDAIAWDLPGHGGSPATREPFSVSDLADAVVRLADDASVPEFYYAGVSLGGHVGLELALRHPSRLLGLAIICSAAKFGDAAAWTARAATVRAQGTPVLIDGAAKRWFSEGFIARQSARSSGMLHDLSDT